MKNKRKKELIFAVKYLLMSLLWTLFMVGVFAFLFGLCIVFA